MGLVGVAVFFGGKAAGWTWNPDTIALAVVLGCVALAILMFVAALIAVPVIVFFPAYSIYFFAPRYAPLASLLWPEPQPGRTRLAVGARMDFPHDLPLALVNAQSESRQGKFEVLMKTPCYRIFQWLSDRHC